MLRDMLIDCVGYLNPTKKRPKCKISQVPLCSQIEGVYFEGSMSCFPVLYPCTDAAASRAGERSAVAVGTLDST